MVCKKTEKVYMAIVRYTLDLQQTTPCPKKGSTAFLPLILLNTDRLSKQYPTRYFNKKLIRRGDSERELFTTTSYT